MTAMRAEAAGQISVSENYGLTSALYHIAAVRVVGFRQAARDPKQTFNCSSQNMLQRTFMRPAQVYSSALWAMRAVL